MLVTILLEFEWFGQQNKRTIQQFFLCMQVKQSRLNNFNNSKVIYIFNVGSELFKQLLISHAQNAKQIKNSDDNVGRYKVDGMKGQFIFVA